MRYLIYLIYPLLLVFLLWGAKLFKKGDFNEEFLSYNQTKYFQGFLAVCIMLHHIGQEMCAPWQQYTKYPGLELFVPLGYLFVGMFLLFSGYGLYVSYEKKPGYLAGGFFRRRVLPLIIGYYVSGWIFLAARFLMGEKMTARKLICYITGAKLSNPYGWFALIMPLLYLFFYLAFKYCRKPVLAVTLMVFVYMLAGTCINHNDYLMTGQWWYNSVSMFPLGLLLAAYKDRLVTWAKKRYILKLIICVALFAGSWWLSQYTQNRFSYYGEEMGLPMMLTVAFRWICLVGEMLCTATFSGILLLLGLKIKLGNRVLAFMGTITFEFYIIHGLVLELFSYQFCDIVPPLVRITNVALTVIVVAAASVLPAICMKKICHAFDRSLPEGKRPHV